MSAWIIVGIIIAVIIIAVGLALIFKEPDDKWTNLGIGLVTGTAVAITLVIVQEIDEEKYRSTAEQNQFLLTMGTSQNLRGFQPTEDQKGYMKRIILRDKDLTSANFDGITFGEKADLSYSTLQVATLRDSELKGTTLVGTDFSSADLSRAMISGADLRYARLAGAILTGINWSGKKTRVNAETCWPANFAPGTQNFKDSIEPNLIQEEIRKADGTTQGASPGHQC